jgi:hypothetical protein
MPNEPAEFTEKEFLEVAARHAREIGRSGDPQNILSRYARDYTNDPKGAVTTVFSLFRGQNREYPKAAIEGFLRTNAETHRASFAEKLAPASSAPRTQSAKPTRESEGQPKPSFPPGWSVGRIISHLRSRDQFLQLGECRASLEEPAFLRSVRNVPPQHVSAHLLARLLNIPPANVDGIEKGSIPVSEEICDSLIKIFGFHERAAEEFRSRASIEKSAKTPEGSAAAGASEAKHRERQERPESVNRPPSGGARLEDTPAPNLLRAGILQAMSYLADDDEAVLARIRELYEGRDSRVKSGIIKFISKRYAKAHPEALRPEKSGIIEALGLEIGTPAMRAKGNEASQSHGRRKGV